MRKTRQTTEGIPGGDCFRAALSSVLDVELEFVPDFMNEAGTVDDPYSNDWVPEFVAWVVDVTGREPLPIPFEFVDDFGLTPTGVVTGHPTIDDDGNGVGFHAVVYHKGAFWWNPAGPDYGDLEFPLVVWAVTVPDPVPARRIVNETPLEIYSPTIQIEQGERRAYIIEDDQTEIENPDVLAWADRIVRLLNEDSGA